MLTGQVTYRMTYNQPLISVFAAASITLSGVFLLTFSSIIAVVHSLRHSMRDRLRAVECPSDIIDQIGGWSSATVGSSYGKGYELPVLAKWMKMMEG